MKTANIIFFFLSLHACAQGNIIFHGTSDASAAVALSKDMFVIADDENNVLRVYKINEPFKPVHSYDLTGFLEAGQEHPEADIEGATRIGNRIYWITSHGRNKDGKIRPSRYRFFAVTFKIQKEHITIRPVGKPYKKLVHELVKAPNMALLGLERATRLNVKLKKEERVKLAPKRDGLNIEGLCASQDGRTIYIGLRNPQTFNRKTLRQNAIVVPLTNPAEVIEKGAEPVFGEPVLWDLAGLGIRSMEYSDFHKGYFIVAGPTGGESKFVLYRWSGKKDDQPMLIQKIYEDNNFTLETVSTFMDFKRMLLLSDDGTLVVDVSGASECMKGKLIDGNKCLNKYLTNPMKKTFRGIWLEP